MQISQEVGFHFVVFEEQKEDLSCSYKIPQRQTKKKSYNKKIQVTSPFSKAEREREL